MKRITPEQYTYEVSRRVFDTDIQPRTLLGLRWIASPSEIVQLPFFVISSSAPLPPDHATGMHGRMVTKKLKPFSLTLEITDGHFHVDALAKALGDVALGGDGDKDGYVLAITADETGLPSTAFSVLTSE